MKHSPNQYSQLVSQARKFSEPLKGKGRFEHAEVNRVALESMLVGWMFATMPNEAKRAGFFEMARDQALQAANDAVGFDIRFTNSLT